MPHKVGQITAHLQTQSHGHRGEEMNLTSNSVRNSFSLSIARVPYEVSTGRFSPEIARL